MRIVRPYTAAMKILAIGDIHLGRRPSRIPQDFPLTSDELSPSAAWRQTCNLAIEKNVALVLLAGDVIESERDFFEGYRELKAGVERLADAGIRVIAVAGNHDVEVLPRLADALGHEKNFVLLGRGGVWESLELDAVTIWGWSFPTREVRKSPLEDITLERGSGFNLALLHCDLEASGSPYAPVKRRELEGVGFDAWLLGHIHAPYALSAKSPMGYLGCLSGMDPGEPGPHGPWLMNFEGERLIDMKQIPIAPIRWEALEIDTSELDDLGALENLLVSRVGDLDRTLFSTGPSPLAIGLRVRFTGQTEFVEQLPGRIDTLVDKGSHFNVGDRVYFVEHCETAVLPRTDLGELAKRADPLGLLAGKLLLLDQPADHPERARLIAAAKRRMQTALADHQWRELESNAEELLDDRIAQRLRITGNAALLRLYAQQQDDAA